MNRRLGILLTGLLLIAAPVLAAETKSGERGKKLLPKLFESAAANAADATVRIQVDGKDTILGTVVASNGWILTKGSELIKDKKLKPSISCLFRDGSSFDPEVKGYNEKTDLMLLKVETETLTAVKFASKSKAEPGNWVVATGFLDSRRTMAETDGIGPLAVGVISSASRALYLPESRIENANRGYMGIIFEPVDDDKNTKIDEVKNESAKRAGLKKGDAIIGLNEKTVGNREEIFNVMNETRPGETIQVKVKRKGKTGEDEEITLKFDTITSANMGDRGAVQNVMGGNLSDRRGGFPSVIQHDVVLTPKQCGGPLVDIEGNVLGINIARAGRVETWALASDVIAPVLKEMQEGKFPFPKTTAVKKEEPSEPKK